MDQNRTKKPDRKWTKTGTKMERKLPENGLKRKHGPKIDRKWTKNGQKMDKKWIENQPKIEKNGPKIAQ